MRNAKENVQILMSTYNGSQYLEPLMESLFDQDYPNIDIFVRDNDSDHRVFLKMMMLKRGLGSAR